MSNDHAFGWSYPPGCSGPPNTDENPCAVCGQGINDCICPECPVCEVQGNPLCYDGPHGMKRSPEQKRLLAKYQDWLEEERRLDAQSEAEEAMAEMSGEEW